MRVALVALVAACATWHRSYDSPAFRIGVQRDAVVDHLASDGCEQLLPDGDRALGGGRDDRDR